MTLCITTAESVEVILLQHNVYKTPSLQYIMVGTKILAYVCEVGEAVQNPSKMLIRLRWIPGH